MNKPGFFVRNAMAGAEGDSAEVRRLFPLHEFMNFDPFVLWDDFTISPGAGFPDHPHRGFEGITYVMQGAVNHTDNLGNNSTVSAGGLQRFTAGSGIIHSEMPSPDTVTRGIQMWVNLPTEQKKRAPDYQQVDPGEIEQTTTAGVTVRHLSGQGAALQLHTDVIYRDVSLDAGASYSADLDQRMRGIVYVFQGEIALVAAGERQVIGEGNSGFIEYCDNIDIQSAAGARIMLCFGVPHHQPIYQHGPFVD